MKLSISKKNIWEKCPYKIKKVLKPLLSTIPTEYWLGRKFNKNMKFVHEAEYWTKDKIINYQKTALNRICSYAYKNSNFYQKMFEECNFDPNSKNIIDNIKKLPFTDKSIVNKNLNEMITVSKNDRNIDYITTSGTSGVPLAFYTTNERSYFEFPYIINSWKRIGYKLGDNIAVLRGRIIKDKSNGFPYEYDPILNQHYYSTFEMTDKNMKQYLNHIQTLGDCFLHVYPSSIYAIARFIKASKYIPPINIKGILAESENIYTDQRKLVEEIFGCRYYSSYGHTEKLIFGAECEHTDNYHIYPTYGYFELVDEDGNEIKEKNKTGEMVGTGFVNQIVPFIRYRTGDYATYVDESCVSCGRNHIIIKKIRGHNLQENLVCKDGSFIPWSSVNMHDDTFDNVRQFQFFQDSPGFVILKLKIKDSYKSTDTELIYKNLKSKFGNRLYVNIKLDGEIKYLKSGKALFVDQNIESAKMKYI